MSDGISQLVAIGAQDAFLTGNPEISFFRSTYKRHTNFSHVTTRQVIQGNPSNNAMSTVRFERKGDLLNHVYILCTEDRTANALANWSNIVSSVDLLIGGQVIDTQYPEFSENLAPELLAQNLSKSSSGNRSGATSDFFPLRFSFFENCQSAIPLVSLQYHDVEIRINWGTITGDKKFEVYTNFIYLDTEERQILSNSPQNILMTQIQKAPFSNVHIMDLSFNHPIKYLAMSNTTPVSGSIFEAGAKIKLQINGVDIDDFKLTIPNFTTTACYYHAPFSVGVDNNLMLMPFCLDTSKIQPSGSLNFSRLDSARLMSEEHKFSHVVYGVNYNVLRIQNGMGGLLYAN